MNKRIRKKWIKQGKIKEPLRTYSFGPWEWSAGIRFTKGTLTIGRGRVDMRFDILLMPTEPIEIRFTTEDAANQEE